MYEIVKGGIDFKLASNIKDGLRKCKLLYESGKY